MEEYLNKIICADCLDIMRRLPDKCVDSIVTDPPYELGFMGKSWDNTGIAYNKDMWAECLRVLKPGGHLLAFGGTRTYHRMAVAIEDAGFEVRDMLEWIYASGFPKSLSIGKAINKLETKEWSKISKALDNINQKSIMKVWKNNSNNVKIVETQSKKSQTEIGICMSKNGFAQENVVGNITQKNCDLLVNFAEQNLKEAQAINTKINTALKNVEAEIRQLQNNVKSAERQSQDQNLNQAMSIFTAPVNVKEWLKENTEVNLKVDEALKTLRGNKKYSNEEITSVLCAVIPSILKHTILNQSRTFQNLDTNQKMECASVINVIITEYTAENLISNTVSILKSKAVDKLQGNEREVEKHHIQSKTNPDIHAGGQVHITMPNNWKVTKGTSEWEGWGTALKPAHEPICMARKPLAEKTVAENVLKYGTGAIDIDGCRIPISNSCEKKHLDDIARGQENATNGKFFGGNGKSQASSTDTQGRFPANIICTDDALNDGMMTKTGSIKPHISKDEGIFGTMKGKVHYNSHTGDSGSKSRYFDIDVWAEKHGLLQFPKASKRERNEGLDDMQGLIENGRNPENRVPMKNGHPTVKPVHLMSWLVKLVSKEGDTVLDPFMGSGTTGVACKKLGRSFIGIEISKEYCDIAEQRLKNLQPTLI